MVLPPLSPIKELEINAGQWELLNKLISRNNVCSTTLDTENQKSGNGNVQPISLNCVLNRRYQAHILWSQWRPLFLVQTSWDFLQGSNSLWDNKVIGHLKIFFPDIFCEFWASWISSHFLLSEARVTSCEHRWQVWHTPAYAHHVHFHLCTHKIM